VKANYIPGITVALVSLPLSTALAIAAGAEPMQGIMAGIYGPMMGGIFGGSNYNILGPAGALVNNLSKLSGEYGPDIIPMVALGCGVLSMLVHLLKLEKYCTLIPVSVLEGFSLGVAITIGFGQFNFALGLNLPKKPSFFQNVANTVSHVGDT
jgi:SulP family sulfate permease